MPSGLAGTSETFHGKTLLCHMQILMSSLWPMCANLYHLQAENRACQHVRLGQAISGNVIAEAVYPPHLH